MVFINNLYKMHFFNMKLFNIIIFILIAYLLNKIYINYLLSINKYKINNIKFICNKFINTKTNTLLLKNEDILNPNNKDWKDICCCDYNSGTPLLMDTCLNRIGYDSKKNNFDYKNYVCKNY